MCTTTVSIRRYPLYDDLDVQLGGFAIDCQCSCGQKCRIVADLDRHVVSLHFIDETHLALFRQAAVSDPFASMILASMKVQTQYIEE